MKIHRNNAGLACLVVVLLVVVGCGRKEPQTSSSQSPSKKAVNADRQSDDVELSAEKVLQRMVEAYHKAPGYADAGSVRLKGSVPGQQIDQPNDLRVAFARPNKIHMKITAGNEVCDGKAIYGSSAMSPGQVLKLPAPKQLTIESLFSDYVLASSMAQSFLENYSWVPLQVVLLMSDDPMKTLLYGVSETRLKEPAKIGLFDCYRVEITRPDGKGVFWIDRDTFVLRRFEYPVEAIKGMLQVPPDSEWSLVAEFTDARFEPPAEPDAFQYAFSPGTKTSEQLLPTNVALLGKRSKDFIFVGLDNKPVTLNSLSGKIAVVCFWSMGDQASREMLQQIGPLCDRYKNNPKVRFLMVNIDPLNLTNADLENEIKQLGVDVSIFRDSERHATASFGNMAPPTAVVLGPKGVVQAYFNRMQFASSTILERAIEQLLAGQDVYVKGQVAFQKMVDDYHYILGEMVQRDLFTSPLNVQQELLRTPTAEKSDPRVMQISPLWTSNLIEAPGNLLPLVEPDGSVRILVGAGREVAELDSQGNVIARHDLGLPLGEYITFVRSAVDRDGRRWYAVMAPGMQQFHVYDENWKLAMSFPPERPSTPHAGLGDIQIADLEGDGSLEVCVGYCGLVGTKGVSLDGKVLWSCRSLADVFKMAVGSPMPGGRRLLFCTNNEYTLASLDGGGNVVGKTELHDRLLYWISAADLDRDGQTELCGLSANLQGGNTAVGLSPDGKPLWRYDLPQGSPGPYSELATPVWFKANGPGQWLLVGADGSLHVVSNKGELLDRFNYGQPILGVGYVRLGGKPVLLITTDGKVEAWSVAWPGG